MHFFVTVGTSLETSSHTSTMQPSYPNRLRIVVKHGQYTANTTSKPPRLRLRSDVGFRSLTVRKPSIDEHISTFYTTFLAHVAQYEDELLATDDGTVQHMDMGKRFEREGSHMLNAFETEVTDPLYQYIAERIVRDVSYRSYTATCPGSGSYVDSHSADSSGDQHSVHGRRRKVIAQMDSMQRALEHKKHQAEAAERARAARLTQQLKADMLSLQHRVDAQIASFRSSWKDLKDVALLQDRSHADLNTQRDGLQRDMEAGAKSLEEDFRFLGLDAEERFDWNAYEERRDGAHRADMVARGWDPEDRWCDEDCGQCAEWDRREAQRRIPRCDSAKAQSEAQVEEEVEEEEEEEEQGAQGQH
ncbi:hypothetical protein K504DRAFT_489233 [Pleomassaria siparia CBS 279.74]|uniref:Uncharacterized protein n=1 Tax=Pleomassaria siparia CBS 279.74 TaxID=1314801 RepID=A0A6G1KEX9_9PLEO|nr:hypothetical protein K504DRAFT_489233 [Pleomassaria siparia CBS 279.74]